MCTINIFFNEIDWTVLTNLSISYTWQLFASIDTNKCRHDVTRDNRNHKPGYYEIQFSNILTKVRIRSTNHSNRKEIPNKHLWFYLVRLGNWRLCPVGVNIIWGMTSPCPHTHFLSWGIFGMRSECRASVCLFPDT